MTGIGFHIHNNTYSIDEDDVQHSQEVDVPSAEDALESRPAQLRAWRTADIFHTLNTERNLVFAEVECPRVLGQVGNEEHSCDCDGKTDHAVHDEQPLPAGEAVQAIIDANN